MSMSELIDLRDLLAKRLNYILEIADSYENKSERMYNKYMDEYNNHDLHLKIKAVNDRINRIIDGKYS